MRDLFSFFLAHRMICMGFLLPALVQNKKDKNVQLIGFGTFSVTKRAARDGINPQTGEKIKIKASKAVKFKAGAGLKAAL